MGKRDFQIFVLLCIAGLSAALVWVSLRDRSPSDPRVPKLEQRVASLSTELDALRTTTAQRLASTSARLATLENVKPVPPDCLRQLQSEVDSLRALVARGKHVKAHISADCASLLRPGG
jgi:hypothetical protein